MRHPSAALRIEAGNPEICGVHAKGGSECAINIIGTTSMCHGEKVVGQTPTTFAQLTHSSGIRGGTDKEHSETVCPTQCEHLVLNPLGIITIGSGL